MNQSAPLTRREKLEIWREQRKQQQAAPPNSANTIAVQKESSIKENNGIAILARSSSLSNMTNKENIGASSTSSKHSKKMPLSQKSVNVNQENNEQSQSTVPMDEYTNLKFKYRNLQKLHKGKMEYLQEIESSLSKAHKDLAEKIESTRALKKSNDYAQGRQAETDEMCNELARKADELESTLAEKECLLTDFVRDYVRRSDLDEALEQVEILKSEEQESEEIINALKEELEACMQKLELLQTTDSNKLFDQIDELNAINMSLGAQLEQSCRDIDWKDQEVNQLKNALRETLVENAHLHNNATTTKETRCIDTQTSSPLIDFEKETQEIETQTNFNINQMIKETKFMAREYQNMKLGNDLMYQQLTQIQENSKKQAAALKEQISKLEQQIAETERDKMDSLEMNQQLIQYHLEKDEKMEQLANELRQLEQQKSPDMDKIFTQAFSQVEQMAMTQIQEMMEKYEECERKLDAETAKCALFESKIEQLLATEKQSQPQ